MSQSETNPSPLIAISIPTIMRALTHEQKQIHASGATVLALIEHAEQQYPGIKARLIAGDSLHRFVNIYVNDDDIRFADGLASAVRPGDTLTILPAVAGGCAGLVGGMVA